MASFCKRRAVIWISDEDLGLDFWGERMRKDRIVEITGLAILLIQRLKAKDYKIRLSRLYLLFVLMVLDREITEENMVELALWTIAELAVGIAIAIYQEIISSGIVMLLNHGFCFTDACQIVSLILASKEEQNIVFLIKAEMIIEKYNIWCVWWEELQRK